MKKKQVAVLDIGSSKITAVIGERGVNNTFIIKARRDYAYDGFADKEFFDIEDLKKQLNEASVYLRKSLRKDVDIIYVGVPGEFTTVNVKDSQISFPKKKKITLTDEGNLFDSAFCMTSTNKTVINRSAIVYELDDYRRFANPIGVSSEILKGKLSFTSCDNYFIEAVKPTLKSSFNIVEFVSTPLAESMYLVDAETRDRIAVLIDIGYISTTYTLIQGDGILFQDSFNYGGGYITALLTEKLELDFDTAENIKRKINLSKTKNGSFDLISSDSGAFVNAEAVREAVKSSLDVLCEKIENAEENSGYSIPEYVPLMITGGGITHIRGAKEHLSSRLGRAVEVVYPKVPLSDSPDESSILSLLDLTI